MIPAGIFATILNRTERHENRHNGRGDNIPYVHVSTLINTSLYGTFCAREFALRYIERTPSAGDAIPPKFQVLYETGHALGENAVNKFIRRSVEYAKYAWGDWTCACGSHTVGWSHMPADTVRCGRCNGPVNIYKETDLRSEHIRVVGHADFLMRDENGVFYIYEIKSIEREGVDFNTLDIPFGDHILQASFYYWILISMGYKVHKQVRIVYIDRSLKEIYKGQPYKELSALRVSARRVKLLGNKAKRGYRAAKTGILPKRICDSIKDSRAKKCKLAVSCFARERDSAKRVPE